MGWGERHPTHKITWNEENKENIMKITSKR